MTAPSDLRLLAIEATLAQPDPRNPKRPEGEAGANWASCNTCGRGGPGMSFVRHRASCTWNAQMEDPAADGEASPAPRG